MAEGFRIDAAWIGALDEYVETLVADAQDAQASGTQFLHEAVVDRARQTPGWVNFADNIEVWSEDGNLLIGVRDTELVSEAFALEYGTENEPPNAFFRTLNKLAPEVRDHVDTFMRSRRGPVRIKGVTTTPNPYQVRN